MTAIRDNRLVNNTGIALPMTYPQIDRDGKHGCWRINESELVVERNHLVDCRIGIAVEAGARAIVRRNTTERVRHPFLQPSSLINVCG